LLLTGAFLISCAKEPEDPLLQAAADQAAFCHSIAEARGSLSVVRNAAYPLNSASLRHQAQLARTDIDQLTASVAAADDGLDLIGGLKQAVGEFSILASTFDVLGQLLKLKAQANLLAAGVEELGVQSGCNAPAAGVTGP
jgi:hypothetical protein